MKTRIIQTGRTTPCRPVPAETLEPDTPAPPPARTASDMSRLATWIQAHRLAAFFILA